MEGAGIWILVILFYLLQAITKSKQRKRGTNEQQGTSRPKNQSIEDLFNRSTGKQPIQIDEEEQIEPNPVKTSEKVSFEDIFNPNKLRDILGVPQPESAEESIPQYVVKPKITQESKPRWNEPKQSKPSLKHEEMHESQSKVASVDITDVDEATADFKSSRLKKSDITSDRFDTRKAAPGKEKPQLALEYFDEPEDIRNAVILKEILDRPRAFRRNIR